MPIDITCSSDAGWLIQSAVTAHWDPWQRMDNIEDYLLRFEKPYSDTELINAGYGWSANFNFGKGNSKVSADVEENVNDILQSLPFIRVEFRPYNKKKDKDAIYQFLQDDQLQIRFKDTIIGRFLDSLEKDNYLGSFLNKTEYNLYTFGHCAVTRDMFTYLGYPNSPRSIAYEDRTRICDVQTHLLFDTLKADNLYQTLKELGELPSDVQDIDLSSVITETDVINLIGSRIPCEFADNGWCKEGLIEIFRQALLNDPNNKKEPTEKVGAYTVTKDQDNLTISQFTSWQDIKVFVDKVGLPYIYANLNNIFICKIYYWLDNQFYEVYVVVNSDVLSKNITVPNVNKYLLYKKNHGEKDVKEVVNVIRGSTLNTNDFIHELRGAGKIIAEDSLRYDMKRCKFEDRLTINGCGIVKTNSEYQGTGLKIAVAGALLVPESGIEILENPVKMDLSAFAQSISDDEQQFNMITAHYSPQVTGNLGNRATKGEVQAVSSEVSQARQSKIPLKFRDYADVLLNAMHALVHNDLMKGSNKKIREYFFEQIQNDLSDLRDFTEEEITKIIDCIIFVKFTPAVRDLEALKQAIEVATNSEEKLRLQKMYFMALGFERNDVEEFLEEQNYGEQVSIAAIENDMFSRTLEVAFGQSQDHITHMDMHYAKMDRCLTAVQQGAMDPNEAFKRISNGLTNTEQHLSSIEGSYFYEEKYKSYEGYQKHFTQKAQQLAQMIQQAAQQAAQNQQQGGQQQQPQIDPKVLASIQNDQIKMKAKQQRTDILTNDERQRRSVLFQEKIAAMQKETDAKITEFQRLSQAKVAGANLSTSASLASQNFQSQQQTPVSVNATGVETADQAA